MKIAQPLLVASLVAFVAACAPVRTVQAPPPPPPPAPPPIMAPAPAPVAEIPYVEPAPRWRHVKRHRAWCRCGPVRHHRRVWRSRSAEPVGMAPAPMAPPPATGAAPAPAMA